MFQRLDSVIASMPPAPLAGIAAGAVLLRLVWARRRNVPRSLRERAFDFAVRAICSAVTATALLVLAGRIFLFTAGFSLSAMGAAAGVCLELLLDLYRLETGIVPGKYRTALPVLRTLLFILVFLTLLQPVYRIEKRHTIRRTAVVLLDSSASMTVADDRLPLSRQLQLAHALLPGFPEPPAYLRRAAADCDEARVLAARLRGQKNVQTLRTELQHLLSRTNSIVQNVEQARKYAARLPDAPLETLDTTIWFLKKQVLPALSAAAERPEGPVAVFEKIQTSLGRVRSVLLECAARFDSAWLRTLPPARRRALGDLIALPRLEIARRLLAGTGTDQSLQTLLSRNKWRVRVYRFAGRCAGIDPKTLASPRAGEIPDSLDPQRTDLAGALDAVGRAISSDHLAGIILLTDARHNTENSVDAALQQFSAARIPVDVVLFGDPEAAPTDAAVVDVQAPDTVYSGDAPALDVEVAAGGLRETPLTLEVLEKDRVVLQRTLHPDSDSWRRRILLPLPPPSPGTHDYLVRIQPPPGDAVPGNNERARRIRVRSDAIGLLVVDARPRWEFRYLKNLFTGRDRSVRSQVVLLHPDRIPGVRRDRLVRASLSRAPRFTEADALPAGEKEWRKFDVVILGDLSPADLDDGTQRAIEQCVARRGATLIVIAGPVSMPHRFVRTRLADLLPVTIAPSPETEQGGWRPAPEPSWRLCTTTAGVSSGLLMLADTPQQNARVLAGLPPFYWRHPLLRARPGARILAWALPPEHPSFLRPDGTPVPATPATVRKSREFIRDHAVILWQRYGLGRVLMLTFDRTWRLRYRKGDLLHHRFWGQILRWAAPQCLPDGDDLVRAGADRAVYQAGEPVRLRTSVRSPALEPIVDAAVRAELFRNGKAAGAYVLRYVPDSPGVYESILPDLPPGAYTARIYVQSGGRTEVPERRVETRFSVSAIASAERVFLAPDREMAERIAALTGGRVVPPWRISDVTSTLLPPVGERRETRDIVIWNSWPWLLSLLLVACAEWYLRKRRHLP